MVIFYGYREKLKCSSEVNSASVKVLSRWLKTLVRHESAAPLCGDLGSAAQRAVPLCRFPPQMMKCYIPLLEATGGFAL